MEVVIVVVLVVAVLLASLVLYETRRVKGMADLTPLVSDLPSEKVLNAVIGKMTEKGFAVLGTTPTTATFSRRKDANTALGCLLLLIGIIPGLLYFLLAGGEKKTTVSAIPDNDKTRIVVGGDDLEIRSGLEQWIRENLMTS